jgi:small subunit ribosomal protein S15
MLELKKKQGIIKKHQTHAGDTGSSEVQIAILSAEIDELIGHLKTHPKDHSSRRGLLRKVSTRRRLMRYLKKENAESYETLVKKLKLKQPKAILKAGETAKVDLLEEEEIIEGENEAVVE